MILEKYLNKHAFGEMKINSGCRFQATAQH